MFEFFRSDPKPCPLHQRWPGAGYEVPFRGLVCSSGWSQSTTHNAARVWGRVCSWRCIVHNRYFVTTSYSIQVSRVAPAPWARVFFTADQIESKLRFNTWCSSHPTKLRFYDHAALCVERLSYTLNYHQLERCSFAQCLPSELQQPEFLFRSSRVVPWVTRVCLRLACWVRSTGVW